MSLGCEASSIQKNKSRSRGNKYNGKEEYGDDDGASVQSMPTRGRNTSRGGGRARGTRVRRGRGGHNNERTSVSSDGVESDEEEGEEGSDSDGYKSVASSSATNTEHSRQDVGHRKDKIYNKKSQRSSSNIANMSNQGSEEVDNEDTNSVTSCNSSSRKCKHAGGKDMLNSKKESKKNVNSKYINREIKDKKGKDDVKDILPRDSTTQEIQSKDKKSSQKRKEQRGKKGTAKVESDDFQLLAKRLNVSLKVKKTDESKIGLKGNVVKCFDFPRNGKFKLEFKSEPQFDEKNVYFKFSVQTNNVWMAKKCVKNMVETLRGRLKAFIQYTCFLDKRYGPNSDQEDVPIKGKATADRKMSKAENMSEGITDRTDMTDEGKAKTVKTLNNTPVKGDVPEMCPVNFKLTIEKSFARVDGFIGFVTTILDEMSSIEEFEIKQESIELTKTSSHCVIDLKSKADARRLSKTLSKFQKETKLDLKYEVTKVKPDTKTDGKDIEVWNSRIEKILKKMEEKKNDTVTQHDVKMKSLREKIEFIEQSDHEEDEVKVEKTAFEDKLMEASTQRIEFLCKCKAICKTVQEMNPSAAKEGDLRRIQEDFGVECQRLANALPIYARREDIVSHVKSNQVSIILGETGSGKSTQIAQYLHEAGNSCDGFIVCTQPRKVAAVQLADRVAQEMTVRTGDLVGYKTGNKRKMNDNTKIVFMTDHSLLNECLEDPDFQKYSCIIVDEAHERSIYTDILLGIIKACLKRRPDLRVVITSATIDPQVFIDYFQCPKEMSVSGRTFPVEVFYTESSDDFENYERKAVCKAAEIHRHQPEGDILVFLTSPIEIQRCCEEFCKTFKDRNDFKCFPLHGQLSPEEQRKVFSKLDEGVRKVVFATNCAETSITIDGIKYVIDTGVSKEMRYDAKKNLNLLGVHMISQSSANQRKGRAGRTASGKCFRLFSEEEYEGMRKINEPEILRVHLGQAILKLAELGVNIRDYDFVESPSVESLQAALETLEFLGALKDEKITDLGRWISKLPFDPKLGYVVYKARENDLLYDGIVLASVVSNGSGLFYRGLSETEAQISARSKAQFGLESGDIFTWLTIYKIWQDKPAKEKRAWCQSNCVNYKSLNYTKTCVGEVITALKHELKVDVLNQYSDEPSSMTVLSKLMLRAYGMSLCHFMGHSRAGYFSLVSQRQVHLHPSSTLAAQNLQPEWLVFVELVKTSREFIKGILVVDEEWIQEAVAEGHLDVNIAKAKEGTLTVVHKEELGMSVFRAVVGPHYSNIQSLEEHCELFRMKHTIIEADRENGTISFYSSSPVMHQVLLNELKEVKETVIKKLQREESEIKIFSKGSTDSPNIRAVLGPGACVRQVLLPHQTTEVLLRKVGNATEVDITNKFGEFGNILEIIPFKKGEPWGFLRYRSVEEALIAVERTKRDETLVGSLRLDRASANTKNMFQAKVSWLRRPVKGDGIAFVKVDPIDKPELIGKNILINGAIKKICISNTNREKQTNEMKDTDGEPDLDLVIFKIGEATEEDIRDGITAVSRRNLDIKRITVVREQVPVPSQRELEDIKTQLTSLIDPNKEESFNVWVSKPDCKTVYYTAFLYFTDPVRGLHICKRRNRRIFIGSQMVKISPSLKTTIVVPKKIKDACKEHLDDLFVSMKKDLGVHLEWKNLKADFAVTIQCENPEGIVKARECITRELKGDVIDCNVAKACQCLLTAAGQDYLQKTQKKTGCVIVSDKRTKEIHLYGKPAKISQAMIEVNSYFVDNESKKDKIFKLKGLGKPQGLMKALLNKFGPLLDGMIGEYKLTSVTVDCRTHTLKCLGSEESIDEIDRYISSLESELFASESNLSGSGIRNKSLPKCVVCLDDVDYKDSLYRLEACGHPYCIPCLQHQVLTCVQSNLFPLVCAGGGCGKEFVWKDLRHIFFKKWVTEEKLIHSSLNFLVSTQSERYKFCPTPNCPVVYEVTLNGDGCEFNCAACFASTCSSCHLAFHAGVSCKMAKSASDAEKNLDQWYAADPKNHKICPGCKSPIDKIEGCNKMVCRNCKTIFCWICLQMFGSGFEGGQKCYAHLVKTHGDIF